MKRFMLLIGATVFASTIFTSCGGGNDKVTLTLEEVSIIGDAKDYFEVVPGDYEVKKTNGALGDELQLSLKLKVTNTFDQEKIDEYTGIGNLSLQVTDENGTPINLDFSPAGVSDWDKINSILKGNIGDEVTVLFTQSGFPDEEAINQVLTNGKGVEITRADVTNPKSETIIDNSSASADNSQNGSGDCDQFCSDYESFVDDYVAFMKKYKANPSDMDILTEYSEMVSSAASMQENAADCAADPSSAARISAAAAKIAKAAM